MIKNIKWFFSELLKVWSNEPSYFSKKRVESSMVFISVLITYIWFCIENLNVMSATDFTIVSGAMMVYGGYTVTQIQKEKRDENKS